MKFHFHLQTSSSDQTKEEKNHEIFKNSFFMERLWWLLLNVLQNRCSQKFRGIHKKIFVLESPNNKVASLMACNLIKKETTTQVFFCEHCKSFKNNFFMEHLQWLLLKMV